ncbi:hypothetical protein [Falsirhodobacter sp. 20TX0035]|nr:hypothetical protein [Falsirhodobacter sp. 20TX0035]MDB6453302.1 hypothetical protein [Falsirhodobacter sp. 20TX0035]
MSSAEPKQPETERGALPDAPLAMPKQVLTSESQPVWRRFFGSRIVKAGS